MEYVRYIPAKSFEVWLQWDRSVYIAITIQWVHVCVQAHMFGMCSGVCVWGHMHASARYNRKYTQYIVPSVAKGGGVSTGGQDNNYGNYTMGVWAIHWYRKYSTKGVLILPHGQGWKSLQGGQGESGGGNTVCW